MRIRSLRKVVVLLTLLCLTLVPAAAIYAQQAGTFEPAIVTQNHYDPTLQHNIPNLQVTRGGVTYAVNFMDFYNTTGGLTRWGYPTSEVVEEEEGNLAQYFQRGVIDWHFRADLGVYVMERRLAWDYFGGGRGGSEDQGVEPGRTNPNPGVELGPWGHKVSNQSAEGIQTGFLDFFNALGGVEAFGFPKTDARLDTNAPGTLHIQAATPGFIRQYFQAAVFEFHPGDPEPVKLRLLGDDLRDKNYPNERWRDYAAFNPAQPLSEGQSYTPQRVIIGPAAPAEPTPTPTPVPTVQPTPEASADAWFGTYGGGVSRYDGNGWVAYRTSNSPLPNDRVLDVLAHSDGTMWFATENGLAHLNGTDWTIFNTSNTAGFAGNNLTSVDAVGSYLWAGTAGSGASIMADGQWSQVNTSNSSIPSNNVRDVMVTHEAQRRAWVATDAGAALYDNGSWRVFTTGDGLASNDTTSLALDQGGRIWVGTNGSGVSVLTGATWTTYTTSNSGLPSDTIRNIAVAPNGHVWIATNGGVARFDGTNWTAYTIFNSPLVHNDVYDVSVDAQGRVWIATNNGANLMENGNWTTFQTSNSDISFDALRAVAAR